MDDHKSGNVTMVGTRLGPLRVEALGVGPPAVLWHSLFVDSTTWKRVRGSLAESHRLLLIDGPSHGGSGSMTRGFSSAECAGAAADVLDHLEITEPVDWVGNAWGGHVGILFAAAYPERCRSLIAMGTPIQALSTSERRRIAMLVALYRLIGPVGPLLRAVEDGLLAPQTRAGDPEAVRLVADALRHAQRRGMWIAMRSLMLARPDLSRVLADVSAPTLFITGDELATWKLADAQAAAGRMRHGSAALVPGTRHLTPLEAPTAVTALVTDFWRRVRDAGGTGDESEGKILIGT
ncbi:MAG: alpha/beta hydrolase [Candidatus Dormibacteraeota bacterium]|uniref:Alpha/beta hydrolase n=2 Tax=Candidatus Aeolococcus gillhamiae TaxID=3127015 RepID=A0A934JUE1_9BACT|nr:alpha/beta hydrolase [Candidatus Dormibacteraeota bacterium]